jgi:succinoglycan biosynthesis protein ExoV
MDLFYWKGPKGNFGDDMNEWFWDEVLPGWRFGAPNATLVGIGSLLGSGFSLPAGCKIVIGSGAGYGSLPTLESGSGWDFRAVRGPRTAAALGLDPAVALTDAAVLAPLLARFNDVEKTGQVIFVPHWKTVIDNRLEWEQICSEAGVRYVSPCGDAEAVIRAIAAARLVLAESMHAAIVADAFRVPWQPVRSGNHFKVFKWQDWADSIEQPLRITNLFDPLAQIRSIPRGRIARRDPDHVPSPGPRGSGPRGWIRSRIINAIAVRSLSKATQLTPFLSDDAVLTNRIERYQLLLGKISRDYGFEPVREKSLMPL